MVEVVETPDATVVLEETVVVPAVDPAIEAVVERDVAQAAESNDVTTTETEA